MEAVPPLGLEGIPPEERERRGRVDLGGDPEPLGEEALRGEHLLEDRAAAEQPGPRRAVARTLASLAADLGRLAEPVQAADDAVLDPVRAGRHRVVLVIEADVVEGVLAAPVHPLDAVTVDGGHLVGERRVVRANVRDVGGEGCA
jgi:hypothetical protein